MRVRRRLHSRLTLPSALLALLATLAVAAAPALAQNGGQSTPQSQAQTGAEVTGAEAAAETFTPLQREGIEAIVRSYILENPEIIREAVEILRQREQQAAAERQREAVAAHAEALDDPGPLPVLGNPDGDVTVVEFFDYRCPYCRSVAPDLLETVRADGNVRLVLKEFPILGEESMMAARAAVAAARQGAYETFHVRLMTEVKEVTRESVFALAEDMGLDLEQLRADMNHESVDTALRRSYELAEALEIGGTPAFVVGDTVVGGALPPDRLKALIARTREGSG